jgi:hypothetical protein
LNFAACETLVQNLQRRMTWIASRAIYHVRRPAPAMHAMAMGPAANRKMTPQISPEHLLFSKPEWVGNIGRPP